MTKKLNTITNLFRSQTALEKHVKKSLEQTDVNLNEFAVMEALYTQKELTPQEIVKKILIPNSSLSYVLEQLYKKELVNFLTDEKDKRVRHYQLTEKANIIFPKIYEHHYAYMRNIITEALSEEEEQTLQKLLKKLGLHAERSLNHET